MNENFENTQSFKQLPEEIKEFFKQLPEETKEKLRNCKTEEEAMDVLKDDMIPIPDDALDAVAGGQCYTLEGFCVLDSCLDCGMNKPCGPYCALFF